MEIILKNKLSKQIIIDALPPVLSGTGNQQPKEGGREGERKRQRKRGRERKERQLFINFWNTKYSFSFQWPLAEQLSLIGRKPLILTNSFYPLFLSSNSNLNY